MTSKSIAVPFNASARKGRRLVAADSGEPEEAGVLTLAVRAARPAAAPAPAHRYRVGERLRMTHGGNVLARMGAYCKVVSLMPYEGKGPLLYRVRSEAEAFERVVAEIDLSRG